MPDDTGPTALDRVDRRGSILDVALLASVPVVLALVYSLPMATRRSLALDYSAPSLVPAYASHFVHFTLTHLLVNVVGYVVVVSLLYLLAVAAGRRRQFLMVWAVFLLAFPFAISGFNLLFPRARIGLGFSGIVMAYVGYLPMAFTAFLGKQFDLPVRGDHSHWLFFATIGLMAFVSLPGVFGLLLALASALSAVLFFLTTLDEIRRDHLDGLLVAVLEVGTAELVVLGVVLLLTFPFLAFPDTTPVQGGRVNVFSHAVGFCLGYLVPYVTLLAGGFDFRPRSSLK